MAGHLVFDDCVVCLEDIAVVRRRDCDIFGKSEKLSFLHMEIKGIQEARVFWTSPGRADEILSRMYRLSYESGKRPQQILLNRSLKLDKMTLMGSYHTVLHDRLLQLCTAVCNFGNKTICIFDFDILIPLFWEELQLQASIDQFVKNQSDMLTSDVFRQKLKEYMLTLPKGPKFLAACAAKSSDKQTSWENKYKDIFSTSPKSHGQKYFHGMETMLDRIQDIVDKIQNKSEQKEKNQVEQKEKSQVEQKEKNQADNSLGISTSIDEDEQSDWNFAFAEDSENGPVELQPLLRERKPNKSASLHGSSEVEHSADREAQTKAQQNE